MKLPENFTEKFILERVAVYKVGQQPSEKESHGPILDVLSKASDSLIILVAKSIIEQTWTIPLLELKEWKSSAEELREADMDNIDSFDLIPIPVHLKADCVSADFMVHTADSKVYRVRFTIRQTGTDQSWQSSVRLAQMKQIEELLTPFRSHKAGPLGTEGFEISSTVMYHLFTPGQLIDKD
ncbi:MAG TPA: hypothetical protein VI461_06180, partial [Chitinophagaceae bacterium]|nr:hypothetical protein [Chitinophagaceae bacterium]